MLDGLKILNGDNVLNIIWLRVCDKLLSNELADPLGIELLELLKAQLYRLHQSLLRLTWDA